MLPFVPIASLLIELDARTNFLACFTHAGGRKSAQSVELKRNILAVLIAGATNLGLTRMSEACGVSYDTLAWTQEWYVREDTLRDANTVIVNHHYGLELARKFGGGTMSSSDGQRFPVRGKSLTGRDMVIHGGRVLSTYTHVSDQWSKYGTKQIVATHREGHYTLDELLGNETDLPIREHATDTHGATLVNFGLFDLVGKSLTPRIRDLGKITLVRGDSPAATSALYPHAGPLLADRWNEDLVAECYPDLLRMGGSLKFGEATASLVVGKWSGRLPPEHPRGRAQGMGPDAAHHPRRPLPVRPGLPAGRSPGSSTRARASTRSAATCTTPSRAPSSAPTSRTRPNRPGASPCSRTR